MSVLCVMGIWILGSLLYWILLTLKNRKELIYDDPDKELVLRINNILFKHRIVWEYVNVFKPHSYL